MKHVKHNLQIVLHNPKHSFKTDPNGFVIPVKQTAEDAAAADAAAKAAEAAALNSNHGSLFDHLLKNVLGEQPAAAPEQQQQQRPAAASSLVEQMNQLHQKQEEQTKDLERPWNHGHENGNGNGKQLQEVQQQQQQPACTASLLPADAQAEKQAFLERYGKEYGYGGLLDQLYPCEVSHRQLQLAADISTAVQFVVVWQPAARRRLSRLHVLCVPSLLLWAIAMYALVAKPLCMSMCCTVLRRSAAA